MDNVNSFLFLFQEYIKKVEAQDMMDMELKLVEAKNRLMFLVDYVTLSPADIRLNNSTFQWHGRMGEVFEEHRKIIGEKTEQYQEGLKVNNIYVFFNELIVDITHYNFLLSFVAFCTVVFSFQYFIVYCIIIIAVCFIKNASYFCIQVKYYVLKL